MLSRWRRHNDNSPTEAGSDERPRPATTLPEPSDATYRAIVEQFADAVFVQDADGILLLVNPALAELTGRAVPELTGAALYDLVNVDDAVAIASRVATICELHDPTLDTDPLQIELLHVDGHQIPVELLLRRMLTNQDDTSRNQRQSRARERLLGVLRSASAAIALREELHELRATHAARADELERLASIDLITGLPNRQAFGRETDDGLVRAGETPISALVLGADGFKGMNDVYGHTVADDMLRQLGQVLERKLARTAFLARYGGDQFAVLLPGVGRDEAITIAEQLRIAVAVQLFTAAEQVEQLTVSIGAATCPDDASTAQGLIQAADHAMSLAKHAGRNQTFQSNAAFATLAASHGRLSDMLRRSPRETLALLVGAIDQRLPERAGHSERVTRYALAIGRELGLTEEDLTYLRLAAYIHDIGMLSLPDALLRKPANLSLEERQMLRNVPVSARNLLSQLDLPGWVLLSVVHQREAWDGSGYPAGLRGESIPLGARIIAVADALDAMTSARAHRDPLSLPDALTQITALAGTQYDPAVAQAAAISVQITGSE
jgi:diguanylate cyclase (GGDEF)-like protein/PAS domain S-box-containing protein